MIKYKIGPILSLLIGATIIFGCQQSPTKPHQLKSPAGSSSRLPYLTADADGHLYMSWVEQHADEKTNLYYARYSDGRWSEPELLASGSDWFVNWADYPSVVAAGGDLLAAHWLHKIPGNTYSYEVNLELLNAGQDTVITPHNDKTATEHGFVSLTPWKDNRVLAVWLDGRQTANRAVDQYGDLSKAMTIRSAEIHRNGSISRRRLIDGSVCDCCQTSLAKTATGAIAAYRNRTDDEIRDIQVSRYNNGEWSEPVLVHADNWKIGGCPVNGPVVRANGNHVLVAWFTAGNDQSQVKAAFSTDGGVSFEAPISVQSTHAIGRLDAAFLDSGKAVVSWMANNGENALLKVRVLEPTANNKAGPPVTITRMSKDRKSGFPQLAIHDQKLFFAWTSLDNGTQIKVSSIPLDALTNP